MKHYKMEHENIRIIHDKIKHNNALVCQTCGWYTELKAVAGNLSLSLQYNMKHNYHLSKDEELLIYLDSYSISEIVSQFLQNKTHTCPKCKSNMFVADLKILPLLHKIWELGFETKFSCAGGMVEQQGVPYISLIIKREEGSMRNLKRAIKMNGYNIINKSKLPNIPYDKMYTLLYNHCEEQISQYEHDFQICIEEWDNELYVACYSSNINDLSDRIVPLTTIITILERYQQMCNYNNSINSYEGNLRATFNYADINKVCNLIDNKITGVVTFNKESHCRNEWMNINLKHGNIPQYTVITYYEDRYKSLISGFKYDNTLYLFICPNYINKNIVNIETSLLKEFIEECYPG